MILCPPFFSRITTLQGDIDEARKHIGKERVIDFFAYSKAATVFHETFVAPIPISSCPIFLLNTKVVTLAYENALCEKRCGLRANYRMYIDTI